MVEEVWRSVAVEGFEDLYEVSDLGRVRSLGRQTSSGFYKGRVLKPGVHPKGYLGVVLSGPGLRKSLLIHRLVLEAFVGPRPKGLEARHLDGDPANNRLTNLVWGTSSQNEGDKVRHGTSSRGEGNASAKLTAEMVTEIIRRNADGESQRALAVVYGISQPQVSRIISGKRWANPS